MTDLSTVPAVEFPRRAEPYTGADLSFVPGAHLVGGVMVVDTDLTVEQALERYPDAPHVELMEGRLVVSASPASPHNRVMLRLARWLDDQVGGTGWEAMPVPNVRVGPKSAPIPDLAVTRAVIDTVAYSAGDVALVVEITSPSTRRYDLDEKLPMWLGAVPVCWLVDPIAGSLVVQRSPSVPWPVDGPTLAEPPAEVLRGTS